ncbi:MAG: sigma factor-like helix-turn-helix DNA-binding protein [Solirubrobacteraceae bacterium]
MVTRLALDHLRSARVRRETSIGEWLPEPHVASADDDPARRAEMADSLSLAFLALLESLSPEQRAAFPLREAFDDPYGRIAESVGTSEQNARQLVTRARRHMEERRPRFETSREQRDQLAASFFAAVQEGNLGRLGELLAHDAVLDADGGGSAPAINGGARVVRTLIAGLRAGARFTSRREEVNGRPRTLFFDHEGRLGGVMGRGVADDRIQAVGAIVNPDKLRHLARRPT